MSDRAGSGTEHVRAIRAAILQRHGYDSNTDVPGIQQPGALEEAANLATVSAHWGIVSHMPVFGRLIVIVRRALRIGLRWYINPIVEQQNSFNDAVVRALYDLQAENDKLRSELASNSRESGRS